MADPTLMIDQLDEELLASDWHYRGEGAANIVLAYHGSSPRFIGKVLRLQKVSSVKQNSSSSCKTSPILSMEEQILWARWPLVAKATSVGILTQAYVRDVMSPLLGHNYIDPGILVHISQEFLEIVEKEIYEKRPAWRTKGSRIDVLSGAALLISDHSVFPAAAGVEWTAAPSISVEIKPKCGFLPDSVFIAEENLAKKRVSRFAMHQHLKLAEGMIETVSRYSPLDLFSGNYERMHQAVQALFETPQNNLRVFVDGVLVFGTSVGTPDKKEIEDAYEGLNNVLENAILCSKGKSVEVLQRIIVDFLYKTKALSQLLAVQMFDLYDIEGVIHAYYKIMQKRDDLCSESTKEEPNCRPDNSAKANECQKNKILDSVKSLTLEDSWKIVRDYLIAATAKDCSIMLTLQPLSTCSTVDAVLDDCILMPCSENGQSFRVKMHFLDLDLKQLKKVPYYLKLDQEIVECYLRGLKTNSC